MDAQHSDWPSARALVEWRERRRRYITLYQRKLAVLKHAASSSNLQKQVAASHNDVVTAWFLCSCCPDIGVSLKGTEAVWQRLATVTLGTESPVVPATLYWTVLKP